MVVDLLEQALATTNREVNAVVSRGRSWTFGELTRSVDDRAEELSTEGVSAGKVHVLQAEPDSAGVLTLLACWRLGATAAPLNPRLTERECSAAREALEGVQAEAQVILWTSGTSGTPRGVALSYDNLVSSSEAVAQRLGLTGSDCWLASLSVAHVGGLALVVRALLTGASLVLSGRFDVAEASRLLNGNSPTLGQGYPVTHLSLVPTQLARLLEHRAGQPPPSTFRCALVGGAHAPSDLIGRALEEGWPLALTYGMTEMTSQVATAPPDQVVAKPGTVGRPLQGVELKVDSHGEILVRGPTRALRYVGGNDASIGDADGWYHTGDFGRLDQDGDLWVTGRRADRIVSGGVTVDALEVEDVLRAYGGVEDACAVGVPSAEWGEVVAAVLVGRPGGLDLTGLQAEVARQLNAAKTPKRWRIEASLPRNANGKVDRAAVRRLFDST